MGQTDNSSLALNFQMFSQIFCLRGSIFSVFALEQFIFVLHYVFSDTSSTQLEQDTQGKITKYTLGVLFTSCESCFEDSSTIFTFPCVTVVTPHLLSTIWPFRPHKPYIFWKLMMTVAIYWRLEHQLTSIWGVSSLPFEVPCHCHFRYQVAPPFKVHENKKIVFDCLDQNDHYKKAIENFGNNPFYSGCIRED